MEIFTELRQYFGILGIKPDKKSNFSAANVIIVFLLTLCCISMSLYIVFESESLISAGNTFYGAASAALNAITLSSNILKKSKIFDFFRRIEEMIMKRKFLFKLFFFNCLCYNSLFCWYWILD